MAKIKWFGYLKIKEFEGAWLCDNKNKNTCHWIVVASTVMKLFCQFKDNSGSSNKTLYFLPNLKIKTHLLYHRFERKRLVLPLLQQNCPSVDWRRKKEITITLKIIILIYFVVKHNNDDKGRHISTPKENSKKWAIKAKSTAKFIHNISHYFFSVGDIEALVQAWRYCT